MRIDPRHLANLLSIARHGSFNRAAAACGISQPALSNSIRQLERKLGLRVLNRAAQGSALNEFGKLLVRNAEIIDSVLQHTAEEVQLQQLGVKGPLKIGVVPSLMIKFMPAVMATWLTQSPAVSIDAHRGIGRPLLPSLCLPGISTWYLGPLTGIFPAQKARRGEACSRTHFSIGVGRGIMLLRIAARCTRSNFAILPWVLPLPGNSYRRHVEALFMIEGVPWPSNCVFTSSLSLIESMARAHRPCHHDHRPAVRYAKYLGHPLDTLEGRRETQHRHQMAKRRRIVATGAQPWCRRAREVAQSAPLQAKRTRRTTRL